MSDLLHLLLWWLLFSVIVFVVARFGGLLGIFGGHLVVMILVVFLNDLWTRSEMESGEDGGPEVLGAFFFFVVLNASLVPASSTGCLMRLLRKIPP